MARLAATAVLILSLLAVANCRLLEAEPETVVAFSDEQSQANPAVPQETVAADLIPCVPTVTVAAGIIRLPSHHRPCRHWFLHRYLRWARHHGLSHRRGAFAGPGDARLLPAVLPEEPREEELEAVVEQDTKKPPRGDGEEEVEEKDAKKPPRGDGEAELEAVAEPDPDSEQIPFHGEEEDGEENESVKAWKGEMLRRFRGHGLRFHHRHHHHEHAVEKDDSDDQEQQEQEVGAGGMHVKLFRHRFHHHHHGNEEQDETATKHYFHHHHDSDNEVDEVEELARRLSKAIMRRSLSRGGNRHHLHRHHHHAEEGGVRKWFKGLLNMNRF